MAIADEVDSQLAQQMASYISEASSDIEPINSWMNPNRTHRHVA
jgi:hypothetical protein